MTPLRFVKAGNVKALRDWVGRVGFTEALKHVAKRFGAERAKKIVGKLKGMANRAGTLAPEHAYGATTKAADPDAGEEAEELLTKAGKGPGARGGRVIGTTSSGKPIYDRFDHPAHAKFTEDEHRDAAQAARTHAGLSSITRGTNDPTRAGDALRQSLKHTHEARKGSLEREPSPAHLPEAHARYFHQTVGTQTVPLDKLHGTKGRQPKSEERAAKLMARAAAGTGNRRMPITVRPHPKKPGHYQVVDGNATHGVAKRHGWSSLPTVMAKAWGSRGGRVIGSTSSGKPIYDRPEHPAHARFTPVEHRQAAALHSQAGRYPEASAHQHAAAVARDRKPFLTRVAGGLARMGADTSPLQADFVKGTSMTKMCTKCNKAVLNAGDKHCTACGTKLMLKDGAVPAEAHEAEPARRHLRMGKEANPVPGKHYEPDQDDVGGPLDGDEDDAALMRKAVTPAYARLLKGRGEGSRGGKIIGHTRSGKPIYDRADHPAHAGFTHGEHREAADLHHDLGTDAYDRSVGRSQRTGRKNYATEAGRHIKEAEAHHAAGKDAAETATLSPSHEHFKERTAGFTRDQHHEAIEHHHARAGRGKPINAREHAHAQQRDWHQQALPPDDFRPYPVSQMKEGDTMRHYARGTNDLVHHRIARVEEQPYTGMRTLHADDGRKIVDDHQRTGDDPLLEVRPGAGAMAKAKGEGSRGGHVIGHKKSGKPKYEPPRSITHPPQRPGWDAGAHPKERCADCGARGEEHRSSDGLYPPTHAWGRPHDFPSGQGRSEPEWDAAIQSHWSGTKTFKPQARFSKAGGEGSRGGHIIGRTKSGKPIYQHAGESKKSFDTIHGGWKAADHHDAVDAHGEKLHQLGDVGRGTPESDALSEGMAFHSMAEADKSRPAEKKPVTPQLAPAGGGLKPPPKPKRVKSFSERLQGTLDKQKKRQEANVAAMREARERVEAHRASQGKPASEPGAPPGAISLSDLAAAGKKPEPAVTSGYVGPRARVEKGEEGNTGYQPVEHPRYGFHHAEKVGVPGPYEALKHPDGRTRSFKTEEETRAAIREHHAQRSTPRGQLRAYMNREPGAEMPAAKPAPAPGTQGALFKARRPLFGKKRYPQLAKSVPAEHTFGPLGTCPRCAALDHTA